MLDRYYEGVASRISPEAPVPVVSVRSTRDRPGGAGNVALNVAALGANARLVACVGEDEAADQLETMLRAAAVDWRVMRHPDRQTITKLRVISQRQQLLRLDFEPEPWAPGDTWGASAIDHLAEVDALVLSDYDKGTLDGASSLISAARSLDLPVLVDPRRGDFSRYRGATLLTPNRDELESVVGRCDTEQQLLDRGLSLLAQLELGALLITRGAEGMTLLSSGGPAVHLPALTRAVFDVTGAGDTVIGVTATAMAAGAEIVDAVGLANVAAGQVVAQLGTAAVSAAELTAALQHRGELQRGVLSRDQLHATVQAARAAGEKLVFTNGCFDLLHAGHVAYLAQAKQLGDRLIVAVNSDASVTRLKGDGRPINPLARRMQVLTGLASVDWVVSFEEDTPEALLTILAPDVLVKGGDYARKEDVVGWEVVAARGGEVQLVSAVDGLSTSALVHQLASSTSPDADSKD